MKYNEQEQILYDFEKAYSSSKETPRALYGVGPNTVYLLDNLKDYNIICLMDKEKEGQTLNGYKICSPSEVIGKVDEIIVIARFVSCEIIYNRIKVTENHNIIIKSYDGKPLKELFDINGSTINYDYCKYDEKQLLEKIKSNDIISFDMFSTLVNRTVLHPEDIFKIVELKLKEKNIDLQFVKNRVIGAKYSYNKYKDFSNLDKIYDELSIILNIDSKLKKKIMKLEFETELEYIIPRKSAIEYLNFCIKENKEVYITSDMYLNKNYLNIILENCGVKGYKELIVSCEYGVSKSNGLLFNLLKEKGNKILHIGDNYFDDILMAEKNGLDTFYFISYYDMLNKSNFKFLLEQVESIDDSFLLGRIFSKYFDVPFILNKFNGRLFIKDYKMFADIIVIPILTKFMMFAIDYYKTFDKCRVLYLARDGYILSKIHERINKNNLWVQCSYTLASRRGLIVQNINCENDILNCMKYISINKPDEYEKIIFDLLGVNIDLSNYEDISIEDLKKQVLLLKEEIFNNSKSERFEYLKYFDSLNIQDDDEIIVFDLVTSGTMYRNLSLILEKNLNLICFATLNLPNDSSIKTLFGNEKSHEKPKYFFMKIFFAFEKLFSPNESQFVYIRDGKPIFNDEPSRDIKFDLLQEYMIDKISYKINNCQFNGYNLSLVDGLISLVTKEYCVIDGSLKQFLTNSDSFTGRKYDIDELIEYINRSMN